MVLEDLDGLMGLWSLPDTKSSPINGLLKYAEGSIVLATTEHFVDIADLEVEKYPIINGFTVNGKKVTFIDCGKPSQKINMPGLFEFNYHPSLIIIGEQYKNDDIKVKSVETHFFGFEKWINDRPFQAFQIPDTKEIITQFKMPVSYVCNLSGMKISTNNNCKFNLDPNESVDAKQVTTVTIEFDKIVNVESAITELHNYGAFLTLCMGTRCVLDNISAKNETGDKIEIIFNHSSDSKPKLKPEFLIDFKDISENYENHLKYWYSKKDELSPIIDYFVEAHNLSRVINLQSNFLKMVQALESYSRRTRKETLVPVEEHTNRIERILSKHDVGNEKDWLVEVLSTPILNEPSCTSRLSSLMAETSNVLSISKGKLKSLAYKIVVTRNYFTHFNESLKNQILSDHDVFYTTTLLKYVLRIHLFFILNFDVEYVKQRLGSDSELLFAIGKLNLAPEIKMCSVKIEKNETSNLTEQKGI